MYNELDWVVGARTKIASSVVDKDALEKAFMDQSYGFVANKAGQLFRDPHRLGFEVVFKNDAMTRMVALYAFRLGKRLLYAPVFFLNGTIKGHDLLYRHWIKKFCPSTEEWVQFLIESSENELGQPIARVDAGRMRSAINFASIAGPPAYKTAALRSEWDALLDELSEQRGLPDPVLQNFLVKHAATGALDRLASLIDRSSLFADALLSLPEDTWCPPAEKFAAATSCDTCGEGQPCRCDKSKAKEVPRQGKCEVLDQMPDDPLAKEAEYFYQHGYIMRDKRAAEEMADDMPILDVATGIPGPGKFKVLTPGGDWRTMIAAYEPVEDLRHMESCYSTCGSVGDVSYNYRQQHRPVVVVDVESRHTMVVRNGQDVVIADNEVGELSDLGEVDEIGEDKPTTGAAWRILDAGEGTLSRPFWVHKIDTEGGITVCRCSFSSTNGDNPDFILRINPDAPETSLPEGVIKPTSRFVRVAHKVSDGYAQFPSTQAVPGTVRDFDRWVMSNEGLTKKASLKHEDGLWRLEVDGKYVEDLRRDIHIKLASMGLPAADADRLLTAATKTRQRFYIIKRAFPTRVVDTENFQDSQDSDFGVELETPQQVMLATDTQRVRNATPAIGDAMDPAMGAGPGRRTADPIPQDLMLQVTPEQLADIAKTQKLPNVFEHGAVGSMVRTYDSMAMLETYIPVFDDCIDRLGRALFLFYFKPSDFEKAYGTDDMETQENDFLNAFKVMGDLTLGLLKRRRGTSGGDGQEDLGTSVQYSA